MQRYKQLLKFEMNDELPIIVDTLQKSETAIKAESKAAKKAAKIQESIVNLGELVEYHANNDLVDAHYLDYWRGGSLEWTKIVTVNGNRERWTYTEQEEALLYNSHNSWVYVITVNGIIVKIGETGMPLGLVGTDDQPKTGTKSRLGRYINGDTTDDAVRAALVEYTTSHHYKVEIHAVQLPITPIGITLGGKDISCNATFHKHLEKMFIDMFEAATGSIPVLNSGKA